MAKSYKQIAIDYATACVNGKVRKVGKEVVLAADRFLADLKRDDLELRTKDPDFVINIIQLTMVHQQGQAIDGTPLLGEPLLLDKFQIFIVYNLLGFFYRGTNERRYKEAFIFIPRKNGKTTFVAALAWGLALLERASGSKIYIVAASQKQANESFQFILFSLRHAGMIEDFAVRDNNQEHSIRYEFRDAAGNVTGSIKIEALASNPDAQDSFNCNIAIADEVHAFKRASQYNRFKEAMKAYTNKLMIGITTAGDNINSFCYRRLQYAINVVSGMVQDDSLFVFVSRADQDEDGAVDYTDPIQHQRANPGYGLTIRPADILQDALQAQNDPQQRKDFLSRSLCIYTSAMRAYFNLDEFKRSDEKYSWTLEQLAQLNISWYGGVDLSKLHDLTAACLYGHYQGVDIIIPHAWFPVVAANKKADEDGIPLFGWRDDDWLDLCNSPTVSHMDVVAWFVKMRRLGFRIRQVGHDRKFCREYFLGMKEAGFNIVDQPQYYYVKSEGFRHIEAAAKNGTLYYLHSDAYEYCVENVTAIEKTDDMVRYEKIAKETRIDIFDASVFACCRYLQDMEKARKNEGWFDEES